METAVHVGDGFPMGALRELSDGAVDPKGVAVVYFYPKDFTGTCTKQAVEFNRRLDEFHDAGIEVIGVSVQDAATHQGFCDEHGLRFPLVPDTGGGLSKQLGILKDYGDEDGELSRRFTFLVDGDGVIRAIWQVKDVIANVDEALAAAREVAAGQGPEGGG